MTIAKRPRGRWSFMKSPCVAHPQTAESVHFGIVGTPPIGGCESAVATNYQSTSLCQLRTLSGCRHRDGISVAVWARQPFCGRSWTGFLQLGGMLGRLGCQMNRSKSTAKTSKFPAPVLRESWRLRCSPQTTTRPRRKYAIL